MKVVSATFTSFFMVLRLFCVGLLYSLIVPCAEMVRELVPS